MEINKNLPVDGQRLQDFTRILHGYKAGKASIERRAVAAENWWKLRNCAEEKKSLEGTGGFQAVSGWLHNVIVSKHADAMEAYPEPNILPREEGDREEAKRLSSILPCILEQNGFEGTWSDVAWRKLKTGTGVFKVIVLVSLVCRSMSAGKTSDSAGISSTSSNVRPSFKNFSPAFVLTIVFSSL